MKIDMISTEQGPPVHDAEYDPLAGTDDIYKEENIHQISQRDYRVTDMILPEDTRMNISYKEIPRNVSEKEAVSVEIKEHINKKEEKIKKEEPLKKEEKPKKIENIKKEEFRNDLDKDDISYEERIRIFKEMLSEKKIEPFTSFKKNLPLIVYDQRFKILSTPAEQKATFDSWMRSHVTEVKKLSQAEKRSSKKKSRESFKQLLNELDDKITHETGYELLRKLCKDDPRWKELESRADREAMLNEKVAPLKTQFNKSMIFTLRLYFFIVR